MTIDVRYEEKENPMSRTWCKDKRMKNIESSKRKDMSIFNSSHNTVRTRRSKPYDHYLKVMLHIRIRLDCYLEHERRNREDPY